MIKLFRCVSVVALTGVFLVTPMGVLAVSTTPAVMEKTEVPTTTSAAETQQATAAQVEYVLPYPGILPDNPLYFMKDLRDKIMELLISDPVHKAEFYLLQSDKSLSAGMMLDAQGKSALGGTLITKGETLMEKAVTGLAALKAQKKDVPPYLVDHLTQATAKHVAVLTELVSKAADADKAALTSALTLAQKLAEDVTELK